MPVVRQYRIFRKDLKANPDVLYLFGDNARRVGLGGQAMEMRGEPNAVGVRTKWAPGMRTEDFFSDSPIEHNAIKRLIEKDLERVQQHLQTGGVVVIPYDGLGTGLAQLDVRAPKVFAFLTAKLNELSDFK